MAVVAIVLFFAAMAGCSKSHKSSRGGAGIGTGGGTGTGTTTGTNTGNGTNPGGKPGEAFGYVTETDRVPGDLDCKGSSSCLVQGGYMKFDIRDVTGSISSATLQITVISSVANPWLWYCGLSMDPETAPAGEVFNAIERHSRLYTGAHKPGSGAQTRSLSSSAVADINAAISSGQGWFAMALAFE